MGITRDSEGDFRRIKMKVVYEARFQEIIQRFTNKRDFEDFVDHKIRDLKK